MRVLALDTETNGRDHRCDPDFRMLGLSYAYRDRKKCSKTISGYLPIGHQKGNVSRDLFLSVMRGLLERSDAIVFHNAKFDIPVIKRSTDNELDLWDYNWYDTMLMQHMINENLLNKSLDYLGKLYFNEGKEKSDAFDHIVNNLGWGWLSVGLVRDYAIQDAILTLRLFEYLYPKFVKEGFNSY